MTGAFLSLLLTALKAGLLLAVAAGIALLLRRAPARSRQWLWGFALIGALLLPLLSPLRSALLPGWRLAVPALQELPRPRPLEEHLLQQAERPLGAEPVSALPAAPSVSASEPSSREAVDGAIPAPVPVFDTAATVGSSPLPSVASTASRDLLVHGLPPASWLMGLWILGSSCVLAFLALGCLRVWWLARRSRRVTDSVLLTQLFQLRERLGIRRPVRLRISREITTPMTWGSLRPMILLPAATDDWTEDRFEVVLLHELIHIQRGDWPLRIAAQIACALYWINPLAWIASRRLTLEQELACDEHVLALGWKPSRYAGHLLAIARASARRRISGGPSGRHSLMPQPPLPVLDMARRSLMEGRLMSILNPENTPRGPRRFLPVGLLMTAVLLALVAMDATSAPAGDDLQQVLVELEALEVEMEPFEAQLEALEAEMKPFESRMESIEDGEMESFEREMEAFEAEMEPFEARMEGLEAQMEPYEAELEAIEAGMEGFEEQMEVLEREMEPFQERLQELEREMEPLRDELEQVSGDLAVLYEGGEADSEARQRVRARHQELMQRMEPYTQRMQAIHAEMQPVMERMAEVHRGMQPQFARMAEVHQRMEPVFAQMSEIHRDMEPVHQRMGEVHERMGPVHQKMQGVHEDMEPIHRRMEEIHREMRPIHQRLESLQERLEDALHQDLEGRLGQALSGRGVSATAISQAAREIAETSGLYINDGRAHLHTSAPKVRKTLAQATGLTAGDPALEAAVQAVVEFEAEVPGLS